MVLDLKYLFLTQVSSECRYLTGILVSKVYEMHIPSILWLCHP